MTDLPTTMSAYVMHRHGGPEAHSFHEDWPVPVPGPDDVLIRVGACGCNNTDINTRIGWYSKAVTSATDTGGTPEGPAEEDPAWGGTPIYFPRIQGADAVGEVVALGANAPAALMGKRVMLDCWQRDWSDPLNRSSTGYFGSERDGGFAQFTTADYRNTHPIETTMTDAELATFSCSYSTALGMLTRAAVGAGDHVLITGASGGVGSALVQLAKRLGATVIALSSPDKHATLSDLGAHVTLPRQPEDLPAALNAATGRATVDVVCDVVGGPDWPGIIDVLARGGRFVCSGAIAGPVVDLDLRTLYLRDLTFHGSTVLTPDIFPDLVRIIEEGGVKPLVAATYPLHELPAAQEAFLRKGHVGNIVMLPWA